MEKGNGGWGHDRKRNKERNVGWGWRTPNGKRKRWLGPAAEKEGKKEMVVGTARLAAEKEGKKEMVARTADRKQKKERVARAGGGEEREKRMGGWGEDRGQERMGMGGSTTIGERKKIGDGEDENTRIENLGMEKEGNQH